MVFRQGRPCWAFERDSGEVWVTQAPRAESLMELYDRSGRSVERTALSLIERLDR